MKLHRSAILPLMIGSLMAAAPATAAPLIFTFTGQSITGPVTASFHFASNPIPDRINDQSLFGFGQIFFNNVPGVFNGSAETASTISFGTGAASQFQISGSSAGFAQFGGDTVFSGPFDHPVFSPGTYKFTGFSSGILTVTSAVPEPGIWAMMIVGFGLVGGTLRYRRRSEKVALAS